MFFMDLFFRQVIQRPGTKKRLHLPMQYHTITTPLNQRRIILTTTNKNLLSILFFAVSLFFLFAANNASFSTGLTDANCYHCVSVSACVTGGQAYGWDGCNYNELQTPPNNSSVYGGAECGTTPIEN